MGGGYKYCMRTQHLHVGMVMGVVTSIWIQPCTYKVHNDFGHCVAMVIKNECILRFFMVLCRCKLNLGSQEVHASRSLWLDCMLAE